MSRVSLRYRVSWTVGVVLLITAAIGRADDVTGSPSAAEQHCLALTLYWEARGEGPEGMLAVGWTVLNRVESDDFPNTLCEVIHQGGERPPCEFSWWCDGRSDRPRDSRSWQAALAVAAQLVSGPPEDPTHGALYFHNTRAKVVFKRAPTARIGRHVFYR